MADTQDASKLFEGLKISKHQDINILLLGETGVGKSTFINSLANYLTYKQFKKAEESDEVIVLIPTTVTVVDEDYEPITFHVGDDNNEFQEVGSSATQDIKTYVFPVGDGDTRIRLIDSPGMGDTRGVEQDDLNCENILAYLSQLDKLHAICFLMKPNNTRITVLFEYCVKQILSRLEKSASANLIFLFTNTKGTCYKPGETLPCLKKVIKDIADNPPYVEIPLSGKNIFCFDNDCFRYLLAYQSEMCFYEDDDRYDFIQSWNKSSKECWRMIAYIVGDDRNPPLEPHHLQNTISVNEARRMIQHLTQPLADITQLISDNIQVIDRHQENLLKTNQTLSQLKANLYVPIIKLEVEELPQPVTVCTSPGCAELVQVGEVQKWHYKQRCHEPCYLKNVPREMVGDPALMGCAAMNGSRNCKECSCEYLVHMHVYYISRTVDDKIMDKTVAKSIDDKEKALQEVQNKIEEMNQRKYELEDEHEIIIKTMAQFAHFLQNNAITPFNDSYKGYIEHLIIREQSLGDAEMLDRLQKLLMRYEEAKRAFDRGLTLSKSRREEAKVTAQTVLQSIRLLFSLKHNGAKIRELYEKQKSSRGKEYDDSCEYVHGSSSFSSLFKGFKGKIKRAMTKKKNSKQ